MLKTKIFNILLHGEVAVGKIMTGEIDSWGNCCWGSCDWGSSAVEIT